MIRPPASSLAVYSDSPAAASIRPSGEALPRRIRGTPRPDNHEPDFFSPSRPARPGGALQARSEEPTSELQSLMRISYAVFCLKKKTHTNSQLLFYINTEKE